MRSCDIVYGSPFFPHLLDAWNKRHHPNMHFVFYEDLKRVFKICSRLKNRQFDLMSFLQDLRGEVIKVVDFLGKTLSDEKLDQLIQHLQFDSFAKNESVNYEVGKVLGLMNSTGHFLRKGCRFSFFLNEIINCKIF